MKSTLAAPRSSATPAGESARRGQPAAAYRHVLLAGGAAHGTIAPPAHTIQAIRDGLSLRELLDLQEALDVPLAALAARIGISKATLHRRKQEGVLTAAESDRVLRFARLIGQAAAVFGGQDAARQWLNAPQRGLAGAVPLDYAETEAGAREVERLLGRIEHGVYS